jgi:hypothetical protein
LAQGKVSSKGEEMRDSGLEERTNEAPGFVPGVSHTGEVSQRKRRTGAENVVKDTE